MKKIKNIIFDLGNVLIDLYQEKTTEAFGGADITALYDVKTNAKFVETAHKFECGKISSTEFRKTVAKIFRLRMSDEQFDDAWNAMIGKITNQRLQVLQKLRQNYRLFVLSNTNQIHFDYFTKQDYWNPKLFEAVYFSNEMRCRKPDAEIFERVLSENNLTPHETLFIDDNLENVLAAGSLGLKTHHNTGEVVKFLSQHFL